MYQIRNLTIRHQRDDRVLIRDFSIVLNRGDRVAVIGEEGNGKSSLLRCLAAPQDWPGYLDGSVEVLSKQLLVSYLPQLLPEADRAMSVFAYVQKRDCVDSGDWALWNDAARRFLGDPGLLYSERPMASLSGGERLRVELCRLLLERPDVLLLDEPSNDLDLPMLDALESFLKDRDEPLLFVSHDETLVRNVATGIVHLEHVHHKKEARWTFARMPYAEYVESRQLGYTRQMRQAKKEEAEYQARRERYLQIESRVAHEQNTISRGDPAGGRLLKKKMHAVKSLGRRLDREYENRTKRPVQESAILAFFPETITLAPDKEILELNLPELTVGSGEAKRTLAAPLALTVRGRDKVVIVGANGSGKTTLLKTIEKELAGRGDLKLGVMPQDYRDKLPGACRPVDFLAPSGRLEDRQASLDLLGSMKFTADEMRHEIRALSGGQQAKLFIAAMILDKADVLLLDEPTRNFSPLSAPVVRDVFAAFGGCLIAVSHDRAFIRDIATDVYRLESGGLRRLDLADFAE